MFLTKSQDEIANDTHRFRVLNCGRRFGKTYLAIEEIKGKAVSAPRRIAYFANTYQQARDIAWELIKKELGPFITNVNEARLEVKTKVMGNQGESYIFLRGWEAIEMARGQQFDFLVLDEVASMRNFLMYWQEVLRPTLTDTRGEVLFISTPKGFNHFYDLYNLEGIDTDYKSFHFTTYDNPHIPSDEIEKAKKEMSSDRFAQEYLADFRKSEGLVYKEFARERHLFSDLKRTSNVAERIGGIDWGYENPAVILEIVKDNDKNFYVVSEWYKTHKTTNEIIEYAKTYRFNSVYADPAEPDRLKECKDAGLNIKEVKKDVIKGIDTVRTLLKNGKLFIHKSCLNLINEFETYSYREKPKFMEKDEQEEPMKENDHGLDALRYALFMQGSKESRNTAYQWRPDVKQLNREKSLFQNVERKSSPLKEEGKAYTYIPNFKR